LLAAIALLVGAAGCGGGNGGSSASAPAPCRADQYGCVRIGIGEPIRLGALLWVGPESSGLGTDSKRGIDLAIDYLDGVFDGVPGELLGHEVQVDLADDACTAAGGRRGARFLTQEPSIVGVVGTSCSAAALGAADRVLSNRGILLVSPSNTAPALTEPEDHQRFYSRVAANDKIQGSVVGSFAADTLGATSAVTITDDSSYTSALVQVFSEWFDLFDGRVLDAVTVDGDAPDLGAIVERVAAGNPDVAYFPFVGDECAEIAAALRADPRTQAVKLLMSDGCMTSDVLARTRDLTGVYVSAPDQRRLQSNAFYVDSFLPAYTSQYGQTPTSAYHANAFDAANLVFDAVRRTVTVGPGTILTVPRGAVRGAILDTDGYQGLSGVLACSPTGDCAQAATIAIYETPDWPVEGGAVNPEPVFSQYKTLAEVERSS
jgi:branched-chain amino acid transport system substrate-binding protein